MKFLFLNHPLEDIKRFGKILVLNYCVYKLFNVHNKSANRVSSRKEAAFMREAFLLMKGQQECERPRISAGSGGSL